MLAALCLLAACSAKQEEKHSAAGGRSRHPAKIAPTSTVARETDDRPVFAFKPALHVGTWFHAGKYDVRTLVRTASIEPSTDLPVVAFRRDQYDFCGRYVPPPVTPAGIWARSRGWRVAAEARLGPLTFVNVLRSYYYEAQTCSQIDGRISVFDGDRPIATIVTSSVNGYQADYFGGPDDRLRLQNIREVPFGDVVLKARNIEIKPLPPVDRFCGGRKAVPNIYGQSINRARSILRKAGWQPVRAAPPEIAKDPDGDDFFADLEGSDFYRKGITEVTGCSPTGFCGFRYQSGRAWMEVQTSGGIITDYEPDCSGTMVLPPR